MKVKILGTGTCVPTIQRGSSSYVVVTEHMNILVDVGPCVVRRLLESGYTTRDIDIIILTHFHVDHTADLSTFLFASNYDVIPRSQELLLIGGEGLHDFYKGLLGIYPWLLPKSYEIILHELHGGILKKGDVIIATSHLEHNNESIGVRIQGDKNVVFSGDTDYTKNLIELARETDLLIAECSFPEKKAHGHLNLSMIEKVVEEAKPKRVILSHLYPDWDDYTGVLHSPVLLGADGMEIEI